MTIKKQRHERYELRKDWYMEYYQKNKKRIASQNKARYEQMRDAAKAYKELMKKNP